MNQLKRLRQLRRDAGLTQQALADLLGLRGGQVVISCLERGTYPISATTEKLWIRVCQERIERKKS